MKFGFIAHPTSIDLKRHVKLTDLVGRMNRDLDWGYERDLWTRKNLVPFIEFDRITSAAGSTCEGLLYYLPLTAEEMIREARTVLERVVEGVATLGGLGAELVGLGGFTSIIGKRGIDTMNRSQVPVTSGNSLTSYSGYETLMESFRRLGVPPEEARVAIVGYPGSIGLAVARLLLDQGCSLDLVHRQRARSDEELLRDLGENVDATRVSFFTDFDVCAERCQFVVAATSSGGVIDPRRLQSGTVVVDVALPRDVMDVDHPRTDLLVLDGGCVSAGRGVRIGNEALQMGLKRLLNGCFAETMMLALDGRAESFSIGRQLDPEKVLEIGRRAEHHGFGVLPLVSYGERVGAAQLAAIREHHRPSTTSVLIESTECEASDLAHADVLSRYQRHINPLMADFLEYNRIDRVFVRAKGAVLTDVHGDRYLDMVAGYGCLNFGHNPSFIVDRLQRFLADERPNFVQYISVPIHTSYLAERLSEIAPGKLERCFFSNSGTEAIEAALKLARAATGRSKLVYTENSYHGKTFGALSVTGRGKHRRYFGPLLPDCIEVPFGDADALAAELADGDVAAFIIEPIQGEGGVHLAPEGYLAKVQQLCRRAGAVLIVDEIQTGMGRTGKVFASEWHGIEPDVICLAKSLSGGLMPIAATLSTADVWDQAYGTSTRFVAHTSTFGGGNLAAAAGLAALDLLERDNIPARAIETGDYLHGKLDEIAASYPFVSEVRGHGLMLAVELVSPFEGAIAAFAQELGSRSPGDLIRTYRFLPDEARDHLKVAMSHVERSLEETFCIKCVTKLNLDHRVLTFITANSNRVLRIQPPLTLSREEADWFVDAFRATCQEMSTFLD